MNDDHGQPNCPHAEPQATRRSWLLRALTGVFGAAAGALAGVPLVGYLLGQRKWKEVPWVNLGPVDSFALDETKLVPFENPLHQPWDGLAAQAGVFVRREGADAEGQALFRVLSVHCAHLGCPVTWFPQSGLFMCPCHGGVYYSDGRRASGPPPRGMFHCDWRVRDGALEVRAPHYPTLQDTLEEAT